MGVIYIKLINKDSDKDACVLLLKRNSLYHIKYKQKLKILKDCEF